MKLTIVDGVLIQAELEENERHIEIPEECRKIGDCAFKNNRIVTSIKLPSSVREIGAWAFVNSSLETINLEHVEVLGECAFWACENIRQISLGPIECVPSCLFMCCDHLEQIDFSDTVKEIKKDAFFCCERLESVDLKNTEIVEEGAFNHCYGLKEVTANPGCVLHMDVFYGCDNVLVKKKDRNLRYLDGLGFYLI